MLRQSFLAVFDGGFTRGDRLNVLYEVNPAQIRQLFEISALSIEHAENELQESLVKVDRESRRFLQRQDVKELRSRQVGEVQAERLKSPCPLMEFLPKKLRDKDDANISAGQLLKTEKETKDVGWHVPQELGLVQNQVRGFVLVMFCFIDGLDVERHEFCDVVARGIFGELVRGTWNHSRNFV